MASFNKFRQFVEDVSKGVHNFTSDSTCTVMVALSAVAPVNTNAVLADITQIAYTNLSTRVVTGVTSEHTTGTVIFTANNLILTASGTVADFRYVTLYNNYPTSPANPLIGWYDHGSTVSLIAGQTYTINFTSGGFAILT